MEFYKTSTMDEIRSHYKKNVMGELCILIKPDAKRKVCKDCGIPGHNNKTQLVCPIKIKENNENSVKIKEYIMGIDCLTEMMDRDEIFELVGTTLNISTHHCKKLYSELPPEIWLDRKIDISEYIKNVQKCCCGECGTVILELSKNRKWRNNIVCDNCWDSHREEIGIIWGKIGSYKQVKCYICRKVKRCNSDRFNYDHLNMFDKNDSVCCMVDRGDDLNDIFSEIDKCQILCVPCHHIVTDIEHKIGFTRIKSNLTKDFNNEKISIEKYSIEKIKYQEIYEIKMKSIYEQLKEIYEYK